MMYTPGSHKQGKRHEVRLTVCPSVEDPDRMQQETGHSQSPTHYKLAECGSRQAIQAKPDHPNRVVLPFRGLPVNMQQVASTSDRSICYEAQQQTDLICVTSSRPPDLGSQCTQPSMGGSGPICLPTSSHLGESGGEAARLPIQ